MSNYLALKGAGVTVAAVALAFYAGYRLKKSFERVQGKPQNPPVAPPKQKQISREQMVKEAQRTLKMDITNDYNFAFCGCQGVGKSYLINSIRMHPPISVDLKEYGSAPTGSEECTLEADCYRFPLDFAYKIPHVALWDLPGFDSEAFPTDTYFENPKITLYAFDCLILVISERLKNSDLNLLKEANEWNMPVILAVNQFDASIEGEKRKQEQLKKRQLTKKEYEELVDNKVIEKKDEVRRKTSGLGVIDIHCVSAFTKHWLHECLRSSATATATIATAITTMAISRVDDVSDEEAVRNAYFSLELSKLFERCTELAIQRRLR